MRKALHKSKSTEQTSSPESRAAWQLWVKESKAVVVDLPAVNPH